MCILCAVQKWSRRVATMLPWLVIPLVALWALSQLLPPGLRFEVTSPRLACVLVLLATLFWYEILVPQLSLWRVRRSARLRERRLSQAVELQKLRKAATRRCRNCLAPYRDQNPGGSGGGRFMCSYCGHVSKRPVLDLPGGPDVSSGIINDLVGKNGWICSQDWSGFGNGNWAGPISRHWAGRRDDRCSTERSFSGVVVSACRLIVCFFWYMRWLWRKIVRIGSSREDGSLGEDGKGFLSEKGENGENSSESKAEKAKRKAEEKRQARLEKEMLEEEERKQREEVARLIEERRKLRDEMLEAEKESLRRSASVGKKEGRRGAEKRRQESRKDKDKGSSKSNSDVEELEKKASRECEGKREFDKKSESERQATQKTSAESYRSPVSDRVKGFTQTSSRVFTGTALFGRTAHTSAASATKVSKPVNGFIDRGQSSGNRKEAQSSGHVVGKITSTGDARKTTTNFHRPVESDMQPGPTVQKKSWLQLFTRSSAVSPFPDANITSCSNNSSQLEAHSVHLTDHKVLPNYLFDDHINLRQSLPFNVCPSLSSSLGSNSVSLLADEYMSPINKHSRIDSFSDDADVFEDPCFVPDPVSLLGPVSESLDNFPIDIGRGSVANSKMEEVRLIKNVPSPADVSKPSPIEPPLSRLRVSEERHSVPGLLSRDLHGSNLDESSNTHEQGTWQMWGTPLSHEGLGLVGGSNWLLHLAQNTSNLEDVKHSLPQNPMISHIATENHVVPGTHTTQNVHIGNYQNGGISLGPVPNENDLWGQRTIFQPLPFDGVNHSFPFNQMDNLVRNELTCGTSNSSASSNISEPSPANCWPKKDCGSPGPEDAGSSPFARPRIGGSSASDPDVQQPVW